MTHQRVTLADIAHAAGLSIATVSRALRDGGQVGAATRERVQRLARELGYHPDPALAALASYRDAQRRCAQQLRVGLLLGPPYNARNLAESFHRRAHVAGVAAELLRLGYVALPPQVVDTPQAVDDWLQVQRVHGVVIAGVDQAVLAAAGLRRLAVACIGNQRYAARFHRVDSDCHHGMLLVFGQLRARGYRRIALAMHPHTDDSSGGRWYAGYLHQQFRGRERDEAVLPICPHNDGAKVREFLAAQRPDCIMARRSLRATFAAGDIAVPGDFGYASLGVRASGHRTAGLISNAHEVGVGAARLVDAALRHHELGAPDLPQTVLLPYRWNDGASLRPAV